MNTPETDAALTYYCESDEEGVNPLVDQDFARKLERDDLATQFQSLHDAAKDAYYALRAQQDLQDAEDAGRNGISADALRLNALAKLKPLIKL